MDIREGGKLNHKRAEGFINEPVDQFVGVAFQSADQIKISVTFGRDEMVIDTETFRELAPGAGAFRSEAGPEDFTLTRLDFANLVMSLRTAERLRNMLTDILNNAEFVNPPLQ